MIKPIIDFKISDDDEVHEPGSFTTFLPPNDELIAKTNDLVKKLNQKNNEIERLCILLDTMEPVPGLDVEKYRKLIDSSNNSAPDAPVDYRDTKIVQLAKKIRRLTVTLNKEHATAESRLDKIDELENKCAHLQTLLANANSINKDNNKASAKVHGDPDQLKRELESSHKQVTDLKHKNFQLNEEIKSLTRAFAKEVGDGANIEEILKAHNSANSASIDPNPPKEKGWRGRAQQITMLKIKVKKLEQQLTESAMNNSIANNNNNNNLSSPSLKSGITDAFSRLYNAETESTYKSKRFSEKEPDADRKAADELEDMANQRKEAMEIISQEHAQLLEQNQMLETKVTASKARIKNLETDCLKHKQQVKVMIDKTETDDQLISALRDELERLREQLVSKKAKDRKAVADAAPKEVKLRPDGKVSHMQHADPPHLEAEVQRLQRMCKQQQAQIATHEQIIAELRNSKPTRY